MFPPVPHRLCELAPRILILGALALPASGAQDEIEPMTPSETEAVQILRSLRDPRAPGPEVIGPRIAGLGSEVIDDLFSILVTRRVPGLEQAGEQQLSEPQTAAILAALEEFGRDSVLPRARELFATTESRAARAAAMQALGAVSKSQDLALLCEWALPTEEELEQVEIDPLMSTTLRQATTATLRRDPRGFHLLQATWSGLAEELLPDLVLAVGATGDSRGLDFFAEIYLWNGEVRYLVLTQVPLVGPADSGDVNRSLAEQLHAQLRDDDEKLVSAALLALAHLEDPRSIPAMIDMLADPRPGVHRNAYWALCQLTGQRTPAESVLWKLWHMQQMQWHDREEQKALAALRDPNSKPERILTTLRPIVEHRLHRHEMALFVGPLVSHHDEQIRLAACSALADLDSRWAVADLIQGLNDQSEAVRKAASQALASITGEQRPAQMEAWQDYSAPAPEQY